MCGCRSMQAMATVSACVAANSIEPVPCSKVHKVGVVSNLFDVWYLQCNSSVCAHTRNGTNTISTLEACLAVVRDRISQARRPTGQLHLLTHKLQVNACGDVTPHKVAQLVSSIDFCIVPHGTSIQSACGCACAQQLQTCSSWQRHAAVAGHCGRLVTCASVPSGSKAGTCCICVWQAAQGHTEAP